MNEKIIVETLDQSILKIEKWKNTPHSVNSFSITIYSINGRFRVIPKKEDIKKLLEFLVDPTTCPHRESCLEELAEDCPNFDDCGQQYIETNRG